jgi:short-subunit dehydrogenase
MSAEAVVAEGLAALRAGRPVQVAGFMNAVGASATRLVPRQWLAKAAGMIFKPSH